MNPLIGQALVTDPGGAAGGGYTLVASSPAVASSDADFLVRTSQVTDFLHLEEAPGSFLSLYDLPSGYRAFTRRFVHGTRRGDYNRVVAHSLIVPESALDGVAWDPWQFLGKDRFRCAAVGESISFPALGTAMADDTPDALPDLELKPPSAPVANLVASLMRRRDFLLQAWGEPRLRGRLAWVLDTLVAGDRPLLPQSDEEVQVLALAWLLLPVVDRRQIRWTTHLAVSAEDLFQLAAAPSPRSFVDARRGGWRAAPDSTATVQPSTPVAAILTSFLDEESGVTLEALAGLLLETHHSLLVDGAALPRAIASLGLLEHLPAEGHPTVASFHAALRKVRVAVDEVVKDSGLPVTMVVRSAAATARNVALAGGEGAISALREIHRSIEERLRLPGLLTPRVVVDLARGQADSVILPWVVGLVINCIPSPPKGVAEREELTDVLLKHFATLREIQPTEPGDDSRQELRVVLLARLAADLLRCRASKAREALSTLAGQSRGLLSVRQLLREASDLDALLAVVEFARRERHEKAAALMVRDDLIPMLISYEALPSTVRPGQVRYALGALTLAPKVLGSALSRWRGDLFDLALDELRDWPRNLASSAVMGMAGSDGSPTPQLPERRSLVGVAVHLAGHGLPSARWLPFALAEAAFLDRQGAPQERDAFAAFLAVHPLEDAALARAVLAAAARPDIPARGSHRALVQAAISGLSPIATEAVRDLSIVLRSASAQDLTAWAGVVTSAADVLEPSAQAALRWNWWNLFVERMDEASVPREAVEIFRGISPREQIATVRRALPRLPSLEQGAPERDLLDRFRDAVQGEPTLALDLELALVRWQVGWKSLDLDLGVNRSYELTWRDEERFRRALVDLLPSLPAERAAAILTLARSPRIWPGAKVAMIAGVDGRRARPESLEATLESADWRFLDRLPSFDELAGDGVVLLTVARFVASHWAAHPTVANCLLVDALDARRTDYVAAFLNRAEQTRPNGGYLRHLAEERNLTLLRRLRQALDEPWGGEFACHAYRIRGGLEKAGQPMRRTGKP